MRRLSSPFKNRFRALAVELLEERNAPTPTSAAALEPPGMGPGLERTNEPFRSREKIIWSISLLAWSYGVIPFSMKIA